MASALRDVLPRAIKPLHYHISLHSLQLGPPWTYQGSVKIALDIKEQVKQIQVNSYHLKIHEATLISGTDSTKASAISYDEKRQRAALDFSTPIQPSATAALDIKFEGVMNNHMTGFYRSKYKPTVPAAKSVPKDDEYHYMFSTQFEACAAREAFPCFDEPNLKASFSVDIEIPEDQTALSNMPEIGTKKASKEGLKVVSFEKTPVMSTYLLAWAFGDFEYVEDFTERKYDGKPLPCRVYTTRGLKKQGLWALEHAHKTIDLFSELFQIDYPLPKSDLLAVHEFSHGAMENWGLVTYRTTAVLFDEENSDQSYKNRVAYVVAHELAHQWFGNLVTMDWWSELWLNEGFATWVGWYAIDKFHPDWNVWGQFVTEGMQTAFNLDAIRNSHPIEVPIFEALDVEQVFDAISYLKGSSVIRMLSSHLGTEVFLKGVADYLKAHAYGNATTTDLWSALSKASGQDVTTIIDPWIRKIGYPVLTVSEEPGQIGLQQKRLLSTGDLKPEEDETIWWMPLGLVSGPDTKTQTSQVLNTKSDTIRNVDESFYKINKDQTGFYRTNYPPARLAQLGTTKDRLSVPDKIGLIADAGALAISGEATTTGLLGFLEEFQSEDNFLVWSQIVGSLGNVRSIFSENEKISEGLRAFVLKLVSPATERIGWEYKSNEDYLTSQLRALLISTAGLAGHETTVTEAKRRFDLYMTGSDKSAIHRNLRGAVWRIAINSGRRAEYAAVQNEFLTTKSIDGKEIALQSMGRVQTAELAREYLDFLLSDHVAVQDVHSGAIALAVNAKTRGAQWQGIKADWEKVKTKFGSNLMVLDRFLKGTLTKFASEEIKKDVAGFFDDKDNTGYDRGLGVISDTIGGNASYKERDSGLVLEWLQARKYV